MREIINIHVGQAGTQLGQSFWELFCLEHGISKDGALETKADKGSTDTLFAEGPNERYVPRALFVDTEPSVIGTLRKSNIGTLFNPSLMITGREDAANNFARGFYTIGREILPGTLDEIRRMAEQCDSLQGFMFSHSVGGGTGSGFTSRLAENIGLEYKKRSRLELMMFPSPNMATAAVEPYNAVLAMKSLTPNVDCTLVVDNESLYRHLRDRLEIRSPNYFQLNEVIAQVISATTASIRFAGSLNVDLTEFSTNLVPFQRLHYSVMGFAPFVSAKHRDTMASNVANITAALFERNASLLSCNLAAGRYVSCCLLYRGDVAPRDVQEIIGKIKAGKKMQLVDWCPTGFKTGINAYAPRVISGGCLAEVPRAVCMLASSTAIADSFRKITKKFTLMYKKKAFVHWYVGEGMEESELDEALDDVQRLEAEYKELESIGDDSLCSVTDGL